MGNDIPQSDIADPARTETLILFVEKWEGKEEEGFQWKFSLGHRDSFRYCGMELEDMQGRPIPFKRFSGGLCSGGGGTTRSEYFTLTRPYEQLKVRILHADPRYIEIRKVPVDISVGMGGPLTRKKSLRLNKNVLPASGLPPRALPQHPGEHAMIQIFP